MWTFDDFFGVSLKKTSNKQSSCRWFETPGLSCEWWTVPFPLCDSLPHAFLFPFALYPYDWIINVDIWNIVSEISTKHSEWSFGETLSNNFYDWGIVVRNSYIAGFLNTRDQSNFMMTSSNGNIFRVTGHLCGEFTGPRWIPHTKASDAELWCFLWSASE